MPPIIERTPVASAGYSDYRIVRLASRSRIATGTGRGHTMTAEVSAECKVAYPHLMTVSAIHASCIMTNINYGFFFRRGNSAVQRDAFKPTPLISTVHRISVG